MLRGILRSGMFGQQCSLSGHWRQSIMLARYKRVSPSLTSLPVVARKLTCWAGVSVALLVKREVFPTEGPVLAIRLVDHRDVGCDLLAVDQPVEGCSRTIGGVSREPRWLNVEAPLIDHDLGRARLRPGGSRATPRHP